jgi:hypothetical protein
MTMGIIESTIAMLFRCKAPTHRTDAQQRQRTAAILRPIIDQAADVAECLIDNEREKANDTKAPPAHR